MKEVLLLTQKKQLAFAAAQMEPPSSQMQEIAKAALIEQGVSTSKAVELIRKQDPQLMLDQMNT